LQRKIIFRIKNILKLFFANLCADINTFLSFPVAHWLKDVTWRLNISRILQ